jgi:hypothetical protein
MISQDTSQDAKTSQNFFCIFENNYTEQKKLPKERKQVLFSKK